MAGYNGGPKTKLPHLSYLFSQLNAMCNVNRSKSIR